NTKNYPFWAGIFFCLSSSSVSLLYYHKTNSFPLLLILFLRPQNKKTFLVRNRALSSSQNITMVVWMYHLDQRTDFIYQSDLMYHNLIDTYRSHLPVDLISQILQNPRIWSW
ncbi:hypothetical protein Ccrd_010454, partial [Cynara cardunculus var. scolymus]